MVSARPRNTRQGFLSEDVAKLVLSTIGTAVHVPVEQDVGIDFYCTLGNEIGQRFIVENYYLVQVKSTKENIVWVGDDEIRWGTSHNYPMLFCVVAKNGSETVVEFYQTAKLVHFSMARNLRKITFQFDAESGVRSSTLDEEIIGLGKPIISVGTNIVGNVDLIRHMRDVLKSWILLDQANIDLRNIGGSLYMSPASYETNSKVAAPFTFSGNFLSSFSDELLKTKFHDMLFRQLGYLISFAASSGNDELFDSIQDFSRQLTSLHTIQDCWGVHLFAFLNNAAVDKAGRGTSVTLHQPRLNRDLIFKKTFD